MTDIRLTNFAAKLETDTSTFAKALFTSVQCILLGEREEMAEYTSERREQYLPVPNGSDCGHRRNGISLKGVRHDVKQRIPWIMSLMLNFILIIVVIVLLVFHSGPCNHCTVIQVDNCPDGWIGFQRRCYYFADVDRNWTSSQAECASFNASLAVIDSQEEMDFIRRYKGLADHWIGLQRNLETEPWKWIDGTEFSNWFEVRGGGGECVYMNDKQVARSSSCRREERWICSKPLESRLKALNMTT